MKVKDSPLYKTLCEAVRKEDHTELLRMLEMVDWQSDAIGWRGRDSTKLAQAFSWAKSPQGVAYWCELSHRLQRAGWECW